jgi:hypothetical protein
LLNFFDPREDGSSDFDGILSHAYYLACESKLDVYGALFGYESDAKEDFLVDRDKYEHLMILDPESYIYITCKVGRYLALDQALSFVMTSLWDYNVSLNSLILIRHAKIESMISSVGFDNRISLSQYSDNYFEHFSLDLNTSNLYILTKLIVHIPQKKRTRDQVDRFNDFLNAWVQIPTNPWKREFSPPAYTASNIEWKSFGENIFQLVTRLLNIDLRIKLTTKDRKCVSDYIKVNEFIWECMQEASEEARKEYINIILQAPEK